MISSIRVASPARWQRLATFGSFKRSRWLHLRTVEALSVQRGEASLINIVIEMTALGYSFSCNCVGMIKISAHGLQIQGASAILRMFKESSSGLYFLPVISSENDVRAACCGSRLRSAVVDDDKGEMK